MLSIIIIVGVVLSVIAGLQPAYADASAGHKKAAVIVTKKLALDPEGAVSSAVWSSSDENIAAVSSDGVVTGIKAGTVTVTATDGGRQYTYIVTVKNGISKARLTLDKGETGSLKLLGTRIKSAESGDPKVAAVSKTGKVRGISAGTAVITLTGTDKKDYRCRVTVRDVEAAVSAAAYGDGSEDGSVYETEEVIEVSSAEEFSMAMSEMIEESGVGNTRAAAENNRFYSKRLIVKTDGTDISFSGYNPAKVVKDENNIYYIQFLTCEDAEKACGVISGLPHVVYAEPDGYCGIEGTEAYYSAAAKSWGVSAIGADTYAASLSGNKKKVIVAVVDSGVSSHSFISDRIASGGYDYVGGDSNPADGNGHGTHVAGTVVDCTPGLGVMILPIRVPASDGSGNDSIVAKGIDRAVKQGASVINLSLAGTHSYRLEEAITDAVNAGVTVVTVSGNDSANTANYCPSHMSSVIVVGAVDSNKKRAYFSNYGSTLDVVAPGVDITSCNIRGGFISMDGTSMAAPHISGIAAMVKLANPSYTPAKIEKYIKDNCVDLGSSGWDKYYGYGIPDMSKAAGGSQTEVKPTGISLSSTSIELGINESYTLAATVSPGNATSKTVTWKSSNTSVASVSSGGKVTGHAAGTAVITASTSNGKTATCKVTVTGNSDVSISASVSSLVLDLNGTSSKTITISHVYSKLCYYTWQTSGNNGYAALTWQSWNSSYTSCDLLFTGISNGSFKFRVMLMDSATSKEVATTNWIIVNVKTSADKASIAASASKVNLDLKGGISQTITISHKRSSNKNVFYRCVISGDSDIVELHWGSWNSAGDACPLTIMALDEGSVRLYVELHDADTEQLLAKTTAIDVSVVKSRRAQPMKVSTRTAKVSFSKLKKANQTIAKASVFTIKSAQGKLTFYKLSGSGNLSISSSGVITVKKGASKGTYTMQVKVKAAGNSFYKAGSKTVTVKVKVS